MELNVTQGISRPIRNGFLGTYRDPKMAILRSVPREICKKKTAENRELIWDISGTVDVKSTSLESVLS